MKITCHHPSSSHGVPVILDDDGQPMDYAPGLTAVLATLGWSRAQFAGKCGYKSARSIEKFWQGATPPAATLNQLAVALAELQALTHEQVRYTVEFDGNGAVSDGNGPVWEGGTLSEAIAHADFSAVENAGAVDFKGGQFRVYANCGEDSDCVHSTAVIA